MNDTNTAEKTRGQVELDRIALNLARYTLEQEREQERARWEAYMEQHGDLSINHS